MKSSSPPPGRLHDCAGVDVEFHVVIHHQWKLDLNQQDKSVHIRFGTRELGDWNWNCVDMKPLELVQYIFDILILVAVYIYATLYLLVFYRYVGKTKHIRMRGRCIIPTDCTLKPISYKYVVIPIHDKKKKSAKPEYEFVTSARYRGIVNRVLIIPEDLKGRTSG